MSPPIQKFALWLPKCKLQSLGPIAQLSKVRAVEMFNMEIISVSTATMDKLYSGQITSQHVLVNPGWEAAVNKMSFSRPLQTLAHANYPLPVPIPLFPRKSPSSSIKGSSKAPWTITKGR
ncbi:hypothetical protein L804_05316 [Cryptococcus deuterogattii 2001/935-1]|nr:hypothetical protein L804_05316 [Cryptococcus deuterogattii 2001/935-1]